MGTGLKVPKPQRKTTIELGTHKVKDNCSHASETTIPGTLRTRNDRNFSVSLADRSHWELRLGHPRTEPRPENSTDTSAKPRLKPKLSSKLRLPKTPPIARSSFLIYSLTAPRMQRVRPTAWLDWLSHQPTTMSRRASAGHVIFLDHWISK